MADQDIISALREMSSNIKDIEDIIRNASGNESFGTAASTRKAAKLEEAKSFEETLSKFTTDRIEDESSAIADGLSSFSSGVKDIFDGIKASISDVEADDLVPIVDKISAEVMKVGKSVFDSILDPKAFLESTKKKFAESPEVLAQISNVIQGVVAIPAGTKILSQIDENLLPNFQEIQKVFGGNLAEIDSKVKITSGGLGTFLSNSARSTNDSIAGSSDLIKQTLDKNSASSISSLSRVGNETLTTASSINLAYKNFMEDATGNTASSIKVNGASIAVALKDYQTAFNQRVLPMLQESREGFSLAAEAAAEGGRGIFQEILLAGDAFNLSNDKVQAFISRNRDLTGRANTDLLKSSAAVSSAVGERMGVSAKQIMPIMSEIIGSVDKFGNVGVEAAGKISAQLIKTGTDFSQLNTMVGTFQGFEGASSSVAKLTAAFGVNLDAMELMRMANEDQAALIPYLQEQFSSAGVDIANSSNAMKRVLSDALGGLGVNNVERLLSGTADVFGDFNTQIGEDASKALNDPLKTFESAIKDLTAVLGDPAQAAARQAEAMASSTVGQTIAAALGDANKATLSGVTDLVSKLAPDVKKFGSMLSDLVKDPINTALGGFDTVGEKIKQMQEKYLGTQAAAGEPTSAPTERAVAKAEPPVPATLPATENTASAESNQANPPSPTRVESAQASAISSKPQTLQAVINISLGDDFKKIVQNVALIDITGGDNIG